MHDSLGYVWFQSIRGSDASILKTKLYQEYPFLFSVVFSRTCNLSCNHCLFLDDTYQVPNKEEFGTELTRFLVSIPFNSILIHEGRILDKRHIEILSHIKNKRPDIKIGLIDNGSYVKHYDTLLSFKNKGFMFDWIDISLDGSSVTHNIQRNSKQAFEDAIIGVEKANDIAKSVNILTCITTINADDIFNLYTYIKEQYGLLENVSEWHLIDYSLTRRKGGEQLQLQKGHYISFWHQIEAISEDEEVRRKIKLRFYNASNLELFLDAIGDYKSKKAIHDTKTFQHSSMGFTVNGVEIYYFPQSISVSEVLVIDSDLHYYLPYSIKYKGKELFDRILGDKSVQNRYLVGGIINQARDTLYRKGVVKFIDTFFEKHFEQETDILKKYFIS